MLIAVTRPVSPTLAQCELTHLAREPIDVARAERRSTRAMSGCSGSLGAKVLSAPAAPELPDAVFIEDTAVVLDEVAVIARPGATFAPRGDGRRRHAALDVPAPAVDPCSRDARRRRRDPAGASALYCVGRSGRTNNAGIEQLRRLAAPFGYSVVAVEFAGCLH